jgi:hypothetical protein
MKEKLLTIYFHVVRRKFKFPIRLSGPNSLLFGDPTRRLFNCILFYYVLRKILLRTFPSQTTMEIAI